MKVLGLNDKEQRLLNKLADGELHDIRELKKLFWKDAEGHCDLVYESGWSEHETNIQAQSYVRNNIRRLIRDGWIEQVGRGTYKLTTKGKNWVAKGKEQTASHTGRAPRGEGKRKRAKPEVEAKPKKVTKDKPAKPKKVKVEKEAPKKRGRPKKVEVEEAPAPKKRGRPKKVEAAPKPKKNGHNESKATKLRTKLKAEKVAASVEAAIQEEQAAEDAAN